MTEPHRLYADELSRRSGYRANWMPNAPLGLGDIGVFDGPMFDRRSSLDSLGLEIARRRGGPMDLSFASDRGVDVKVAAPGEAAGATIEFGSAGAFVFQATGCVETQIDDLDELARQLVALRDLQERWSPDWSLVDTVVEATSATIAVAESDRASLALSLDAARALPGTLIPSGSVSLLRQSGKLFHLVGARSIVPLYRTRRFRRSFLQWLRGRQSDALARSASSIDLRADSVFEPEGISRHA